MHIDIVPLVYQRHYIASVERTHEKQSMTSIISLLVVLQLNANIYVELKNNSFQNYVGT